MKRLLLRPVISVICLCSLVVAAYYGDVYWTRYRLFRDNFAMSFLSIHRFRGDEWPWLDYTAWISFVSETPPVLKHPEYYHDIPCTYGSIPNENPFFRDLNSFWLQEKDYPLSIQYGKQREKVLLDFQCKQGHTEFWITPYGYKASDPSWLIYRPSDGQVLFKAGHLN